MKLLLVSVIFISIATRDTGATSVVIIANPNEIVVAGDSKVYQSTEKICKIYKVGSVYWAMSGLEENSVTGYNVAKIVKSSYRGSVAKTFNVFVASVVVPLKQTLIHLQKFPGGLDNATFPLEIAFWGIEHGHPVVAQVLYTMQINRGRVILTPSNKGIYTIYAPETRAFYLGVRDKIVEYVNTHPEWSALNPETIAYQWVGLSISEHPEAVGYPISELVVDGTRDRWAKPSECCHDKVREGPPPLPKPEEKAIPAPSRKPVNRN